MSLPLAGETASHDERPLRVCTRCVLDTSVPGIAMNAEGVCNICCEFEQERSAYDGYFQTEAELTQLLSSVAGGAGSHDVLLMYSGGKDSTYVLYRLVDMGLRVLAVTFDNGYIPGGCFENIQGVCNDAGVESRIVRLAKQTMDRVFATTLAEEGAVCGGCFRALSARGAELALEQHIPVVMTGLSRGQIAATKLHSLIQRGVTQTHELEKWLNVFRRRYHMQRDAVGELIEDRALADAAGFAQLQFLDFFRFSPASKEEVVNLIARRAPFWRKPENVGGCSSNCMINDVGIREYRRRHGYHYYAIPNAWEVRFGHITRGQALEELQATIDEKRVDRILHQLQYSVNADA